ncbi:primosomal protein DnaI [Paenibacillus sp. FJAT-26967]|uniref:primosomal protein DnaI n=1 Tax=Paenibacillus sp. FJAT-26967 TaxID=1729690 RepID=UPI0008386A24|nr:primosomal protein DnaI [Paenibacillus sp. FJAT-26967]
MESLSDMLKQMPKTDWMKRAEQQAKLVLEDPMILKLREQHPALDDRTLKVNMNRLYQYVREYNHCANCPGLENCPNDMTGHYTVLNVEETGEQTYIHEEKTACRKFIAKQTQDAIRSRIRTFHIDEQALSREHTYADILRTDLQRAKAVDQLNDYVIRTAEEGPLKKGLYLQGSFGTGKTFLMCYMLYQLAKKGFTGAIVYMPDFAEDLKGMFGDPQKLRETIELLKETDLLVFDDIGAENLNPWLRDHVIGAILNYRMNRKPTFFTSNYDLNALEKHFSFTNKDGDEEFKGQRIMDRIRPYVEVLVIDGKNKRGA